VVCSENKLLAVPLSRSCQGTVLQYHYIVSNVTTDTIRCYVGKRMLSQSSVISDLVLVFFIYFSNRLTQKLN